MMVQITTADIGNRCDGDNRWRAIQAEINLGFRLILVHIDGIHFEHKITFRYAGDFCTAGE